MLASVLFVAGTLMVMVEGLICALLIVPTFMVFGALGGLLMGAMCRATQWAKHTLFGLALLPLVLELIQHFNRPIISRLCSARR